MTFKDCTKFASEREQKIKSLLDLAKKISNKYFAYSNSVLDKEDIYAIASMAVVNAVDDYNPNRDTLLTTYAINRINWAMQQEFRGTKRSVKTNKYDNEHSPSSNMPDNAIAQFVDRLAFYEYVGKLSTKEQNIVMLYISDNITMREIGEKYNLKEAAISRTITRAIKNMQKMYLQDNCIQRG